MPNRILKESICRSDNLDRLTAEEERLFYRLLVQCDDYGRYDGRAAVIKGMCFPLKNDITTRMVDEMLVSLRDAGLLFIYSVDGLPYIQVAKWEKHQQIRAKRSKYPQPEDGRLLLIAPAIICEQPQSLDSTCPRNPIQSESNPNPILSEKTTSTISLGINGNQLRASTDTPTTSKKKRSRKEITLELQQEFEGTFWPNVPNKIGHGLAQEAFAKARAKASLEEITGGLPNYRAYEATRRSHTDYRPLHPSTWLNQERWRDGPPPVTGRPQVATGSGEDYNSCVKGGEG